MGVASTGTPNLRQVSLRVRRSSSKSRTSDSEAGLGGELFTPVANGELFSSFGRYIEVRATLKASSGGVSPVLSTSGCSRRSSKSTSISSRAATRTRSTQALYRGGSGGGAGQRTTSML